MNCIAKYLLIVSISFSFFSSQGQDLIIRDQLLESLSQDHSQELIVSLDTLVNQIDRNQVNPELINRAQSDFNEVYFDNINYYLNAIKDSTTSLSTKLLNSYNIGSNRRINQVAYIDQNANPIDAVKMIVDIISYQEAGGISFGSPLFHYTCNWRTEHVGHTTYHFRNTIRMDRAMKFEERNVLFASRFEKEPIDISFYMVHNYQEILQLMGFAYNASSIGELRDGYGIVADEMIFSVMNHEDFSHDLFHYYSGTVHERKERNWVTEEGIAYSWGNAYYTKTDGDMAEQKELVTILNDYLIQNEDTDLLDLFKSNFWSDTSGIYDHCAPDFRVGRVISGLICHEVFKDHGMKGIHQLIACGRAPNQFEAYFNTIDQLLKITEDNFDTQVRSLIEAFL